MSFDFKGLVAIVTGAGGGLGKQHALALAARGAKVRVNDFVVPEKFIFTPTPNALRRTWTIYR
jgi:NAD(P)-dependent dehydrogenase (short-subunit alcohol dehydrogenase family)